MKKLKGVLTTLLWLIPNFLVIQTVRAQNAIDRLRNTAGQSGYATTNVRPQQVISSIILYVLGFLGIIFLSIVIVAGFQWMTAGGNEEKISQAKKRLQSAIIGLAIVLAAYAITVFIFRVLIHSTTQSYYAP